MLTSTTVFNTDSLYTLSQHFPNLPKDKNHLRPMYAGFQTPDEILI